MGFKLATYGKEKLSFSLKFIALLLCLNICAGLGYNYFNAFKYTTFELAESEDGKGEKESVEKESRGEADVFAPVHFVCFVPTLAKQMWPAPLQLTTTGFTLCIVQPPEQLA